MFRVKSTQQKPSTVALTTAMSQVVKHDPNRFELNIINLGNDNCYLIMGGAAQPGPGNGILLQANGTPFSTTATTDGELPCFDWYAVSATTNTTLFVLETCGDGGS